MRSRRLGASIGGMPNSNGSTAGKEATAGLNGRARRHSRRRRLGEQAVQALAITSQMALLYPPGIDEWMRRELNADSGDRRRVGGKR